MLTPANIKNHYFQNVGRGFYKSEEVDEYIAQIASSYDLVFRENKELIRKLNILASKIEEYRNDEQRIKNAIINAQRMASKLISDARKESESIIEAAEVKAQSADSITNARIKKRIDEVELQIKETFDKARSQAKKATEKAENDAKAVITDAKIKASEIIENAAKTSKMQLSNIAQDIENQQSLLNKIKEESEVFKLALIKRYEDQIYLIKNMSYSAYDKIKENYSLSDKDFSPVSVSTVDEIVESIVKEKIDVFNDFSESLGKYMDEDEISTASELIFEDIYSSSEPDVVEKETSDFTEHDSFLKQDSNDSSFLNSEKSSLYSTSDLNAEMFFSKESENDLLLNNDFDMFENDDSQDEFIFEDVEYNDEESDDNSQEEISDDSDNMTGDKPFSIQVDDTEDLDNTFGFDFINDIDEE